MAVAATNATDRDLWFEEARKFFDESLKAKPSDYRSLQNIGYSLFLQATGGRVRFVDRKLGLKSHSSLCRVLTKPCYNKPRRCFAKPLNWSQKTRSAC